MSELNGTVYMQERFLDFGLILPIPILVLASGDFLELLTGVSPSGIQNLSIEWRQLLYFG